MSDPVILIPARMAATRLPGKPLADIGGEPMIVHVWRRAVEAGIGPVVVATDEKAIVAAVEKAGGIAVMTRSLLAALFVPLVVGVAQFFSMQALGPMGVQPEDWIAVMANPGGAADAIKSLIAGGAAAESLAEGEVLKSVVSLAFWMLVPLAGALAWFRKQDLSKE